MIRQLFKLVLGTLSFNVVHLLLGLFKIVFEKLEELNTDAVRSAVNSFLRSHKPKLTGNPLVFHDQKGLDIGCLLTHLIGNVCVLLGCHLNISRLLGLVVTHVLTVVFNGVVLS